MLARRARDGAAPRLEEMTLEQVERYLIERALAAQGGNVSEAARVARPVAQRAVSPTRILGVRGS